ncbi:hypothetical protein PRIC2_004151 [Phytophthora ramorum]
MDSVNTASVEGTLMYVQAEGINVNVRAEDERCERKSGMANIVFYEMLIIQTNESLVQFQGSWGKTPEYGPMLPMDGGSCNLLSGNDEFPPGYLQFNGDQGQQNVGPFVGAGIKDDDVRAPYPDYYWFSFPGTCLLDLMGVDCTFAYNILDWVTIDDLVSITSIENADTGLTYANFTEWCTADSNNTEFDADVETSEMDAGLPFWENPLNSMANADRVLAMIARYLSGGRGRPPYSNRHRSSGEDQRNSSARFVRAGTRTSRESVVAAAMVSFSDNLV